MICLHINNEIKIFGKVLGHIEDATLASSGITTWLTLLNTVNITVELVSFDLKSKKTFTSVKHQYSLTIK